MSKHAYLLAALLAACTATEKSGAVKAPQTAPPVSGVLEPYTCGSIQRLHTFGGVFLASQPSADDFEHARTNGVKTVVNLRTASEQPDMDEGAVVTNLGFAYVHLPWNGADELTDEVFARTRELLNTAERPILLHCGSANRVGAVWIPWRVLDGGLDLEQAVSEARTIGLKTAEYEAKARDYVARHAEAEH